MAREMPTSIRVRVPLPGAGIGAGTLLPIPLPLAGPGRAFRLRRISYVHGGGAAATYQLRLYQASPAVVGSLDEVYVGTAAVPVATKTNERQDPPWDMKCDQATQIYAEFGFNAGVNNKGTIELWIEPILGG